MALNTSLDAGSTQTRQRALYSCDRCKKRKRACKRYNNLTGERCFDNSTQCENCALSGVICQTTITRKKRTFYSVSESSIVQLKCLTKIVKAMFPESDPNSFTDLENIAKLLYVDLPDKEKDCKIIENGKRRDSIKNENIVEDNNGLIDDEVEVEVEEDVINNQTIISPISNEGTSPNINIINNKDNTNNNNNVDSSPIISINRDSNSLVNLKRIADELGTLRHNKRTKIDEKNINTNTNTNINLNNLSNNNSNDDHQISLGGAERLFTALLEVEKKQGHHDELPMIDQNNVLTSVKSQHQYTPFKPTFTIAGNDIQKYFVLNTIPNDECEIYTNFFFENIDDVHYIFNESKFRKRQNHFFEILKDKSNYYEKLKQENFSNEEICTMYIVWILGRKGYLLNLFVNNREKINNLNLVSDNIINDHFNAIHLCLSNIFFSKNLSTVKLLYYTSLYHLIIKNRITAYHLISNTCLKLICLGYNREYNVQNLPEEEQEDIRITFWSCFKLHMTNCAILGRLPNISLYECDIKLPKLSNVKEDFLKKIHLASIELIKIMFLILKNREYLTKSKDPWTHQNYLNVLFINDKLLKWDDELDFKIRHYQRPKPQRSQIKLHIQYHYSVICLISPYLIAYALKPTESINSNLDFIKTLCYGINSSVKIVNVILYSSIYQNFNGLLYYDLFFAYNSLMVLLLGYTLIKNSIDYKCNKYNIFTNILQEEFKINLSVILKAVNNIKGINDRYGSTAIGLMKDASSNITLLLKHFKMNDFMDKDDDGNNNSNNNNDNKSFKTKEKGKKHKSTKKHFKEEQLSTINEHKIPGNIPNNVSINNNNNNLIKSTLLNIDGSISSNSSTISKSDSNSNNPFDNTESTPFEYGSVPLLPSSLPQIPIGSLNNNYNIPNLYSNNYYDENISPISPIVNNNIGLTYNNNLNNSEETQPSLLNQQQNQNQLNIGMVKQNSEIMNSDFNNLSTLDNDFLEIINFMNKDVENTNDSLFWDWNKLFSDNVSQK